MRLHAPRSGGTRYGWPWLLLLASAFVQAALECPPLPTAAAPAGPPRHGDSLLWEVRAPGGAASYLFGTIHLGAESVGQPTPGVAKALAASTRFGMEVVFDAEAVRALAGRMRVADGRRLSLVLGDEWFERTVELLAAYGVSRADADQLKAWAAYTTLSLPAGDTGTPLDLVLLQMARAAGLEVFGLETLDEQLQVFERLGATDQVALLRETVCHHAELQHETAELIAEYAAGDLAAVVQIADRHVSPLHHRVLEQLLFARNRRMIERLQAPLAQGGTFVALGALHLPGLRGVLAGLDAAGFRVRPLPLR